MHKITLTTRQDGNASDLYQYDTLEGRGKTDALRNLLRKMVEIPLAGPAEVLYNGKPVMQIPCIEKASRYALSESKQTGFHRGKYVAYSGWGQKEEDD